MESVIHNIRRRWPDADVIALSMNPEDTTKRQGVSVWPLRSHTWGRGYTAGEDESGSKRGVFSRWLSSTRNPLVRLPRSMAREIAFVLRSYGLVRTLDQIVVGGGGQLTARSGPWGFPYSIFLWMCLARIAGVKRVFLNVGAGPLNEPRVNFFSLQSVRLADYVSFRDARSQAMVRSLGFRGESFVFPDNAYGLEAPVPATNAVERTRSIVGVAPMPYPFCDPQEVDGDHQAIYRDTIAKFARFAASIVSDSCSVELFGNDIGVDPRAIEDLWTALREQHGIELAPYRRDTSVGGLLARTASLDYVLTCRFHGVVYAHLCNKPVIAVAHHPKVTTIMQELGLSRYCFDIANFDPDRLNDAFAAMVADTRNIKASMAEHLSAFRSRLARQYDELFPPRPQKICVPQMLNRTPLEEVIAGGTSDRVRSFQ